MWTVVHFLDDNSVEAVPTFWVENNKCAWPKNNYNAAKMRDNRVKPNQFDFNYYKTRVIAKNISSLLKAKEKTERAQFTSDVSDYDEVIKASKSNKSSEYYLPSVQVSSKNPDMKQISKYKHNLDLGVKSKQVENLHSPISDTLFDVSKSADDEDMLPSNSFDEKHNHNYTTANRKPIDSILNSANITGINYVDNIQDDNGVLPLQLPDSLTAYNNKVINMNSNQSSSMDTMNNITSQSKTIMDNNNVHKVLLNYMAYIKVEVNKISDMQQQILEQITNQNERQQGHHIGINSMILDQDIDYFVSSWPISSNEELNNMEHKLQHEQDFRNKVVGELIRVGGKSLKDMVYKIIKKVFADNILNDFTYYGLRNKNNFSTLLINKAIFDAVRKSKFKNSSDDEIILIIGKWLTTSKSRLDRKKIKY